MKQRTLPTKILVLILFLTSCGVSPKNQAIKNDDFPLLEHWKYSFDSPVYKLAVVEDWVAVGEDDGVTAIDVNTGKFMWNLEFPLDTVSELVFSSGNLIVADRNKTQIMAVNKSGKIVSRFNINSTESFQILAACSNYIFIRRVPSWNVEVYDAQLGKMVWEILVDRGDVSISCDSFIDNVYITTSSFISARKNSTGDEIWKIDAEARTGTLDSNRFYYYSEASSEENKTLGFISAVDTQGYANIWEAKIPLGIRTSIYNMTAFNNILVASTDFGAIAINKEDGHEVWVSETNEFFYGKPILINNVIYIRGTNTKVIYAINPENGQYLGYLRLGEQSLFGLSQRNNDIVYKFAELLIFPFENTVYAYQLK